MARQPRRQTALAAFTVTIPSESTATSDFQPVSEKGCETFLPLSGMLLTLGVATRFYRTVWQGREFSHDRGPDERLDRQRRREIGDEMVASCRCRIGAPARSFLAFSRRRYRQF